MYPKLDMGALNLPNSISERSPVPIDIVVRIALTLHSHCRKTRQITCVDIGAASIQPR